MLRAALALALTQFYMTAAAPELATRIIRFEDNEGIIRYGQTTGNGNTARALLSDPFDSLELGSTIHEVKTLLAPIPQPPAIYGIGLNYWGHINATGYTPPETPSLFFKNIFSYNHPNQPVVIPPSSSLPDYEGELAVIIGKNCKDVSEDNALSCVAGYSVCHDVSARCYQQEANKTSGFHKGCKGNGGQFSFSKGFDTHCPVGPALVPPAVLGDGSGLQLQTRVNGKLRQNETTSNLIFGVKKIVSFISIGTTLPKGSVICTGTPDGVGDTSVPPYYLQDGDVVDITIDKIGTLTNPIVRKNGPKEHDVLPIKHLHL